MYRYVIVLSGVDIVGGGGGGGGVGGGGGGVGVGWEGEEWMVTHTSNVLHRSHGNSNRL